MNKQLVEKIKNWYNRYGVPEIGTPEFAEVVASSITFAKDETGNREFSITFNKDIPIGACENLIDKETGKLVHNILLSPALASKEFYEGDRNSKDLKYIMLGTINGVLIHEARHVATEDFSTFEDFLQKTQLYIRTEQMAYINSLNKVKYKFIKDLVSSLGKPEDVFSKRAGKFFKFIHNVVEDLYIESWQGWSSAFFIDCVNEVIFNDNEIKDRRDDFRDDPNFDNLLNYAVCYKRKDIRNNGSLMGDLPQNILTLLDESVNEDLTLVERIAISFEILKIIIDMMSDEQVNEQNQPSFENTDAGNMFDKNMPTLDKNILEGFKQLAEKAESTSKVFEGIKEAFEKVVSEQNEYEKINDRFVDKVIVRNINQEVPSQSDNGFKPNQYFSGLARSIKAKTEGKLVPTSFDLHGKLNTSHLHRVYDGKMFSQKKETKKRVADYEFIFSGDFSGSMNARHNSEEQLWKMVGRALYQLAMELTAANVANIFAVDTNEGDKPLVIVVSEHKLRGMSTSDINRNFKKLPYVDRGCNTDSLVLKKLSKYFSSNRNTKVLIRLSDGIPNGFGGQDGTDLTKQEVINLRKKGINVFSFSLVKEVVKKNNEIYGVQYNYDVSTPEKFKIAIDKLFDNMI